MSIQTQVSGMSQNQRGGAGVRTATEARVIDQNLQIRQDEMVQRVHDMIQMDGEIIVRMCRDLITPETVFRVNGTVGPVKFMTFTSEDAAWSPDIRIEPNSFRKADSEAELQKYMQLLQVGMGLVPVLGPQGVRVDILFNELLKRSEIAEAESITGSVPDLLKDTMAKIMYVIAGGEPHVSPDAPHQLAIEVISQLLSTLSQDPNAQISPEAQAALEQMLGQHEQYAAQAQQQMRATASPTQPGFGDMSQQPAPGGDGVGGMIDQMNAGGAI